MNMRISFSVLGRLLGAVLVLAFNPSVTHAQFVGPTAITIDGTFTDWTASGVYSQTDGAGSFNGAVDITKFWSAMSTANGTSPASTSNLIQNVYYRFDTAETGNAKQAYWVQLNLGTAAAGFADHALQFYVDYSATPIVSIVLYSYSTPYPAIGAFTTGTIIAKVSNLSSGYGVYDPNATGAWALNGTTYSLEAKIPIGWYSGAYGGAITNDGTGASMIASAMFTTTGSKGSVGIDKDALDDASGNTYNSQVSATTGSVSFVPAHTSGYAYSATAAAATNAPVAGAADTITLTVSKNVKGVISTDTTFSGTKSVTISGDTVAPNSSYGSFNNVTLNGSAQTISVWFTNGVATVPLILNNAATQIIGFSLPDLTYPAANNLSITPRAATATKLAFTNSPVTMTAGVASGNITVQRQDQFGNPVMAEGTRTVTLSSDSTGTKTFYPASLSIATNTSSASFTYTDTKAGTPMITAASISPTTITSATQTETVNAAAASQLVVTTQPSASTVAGVAFATQPVVKIEDAFGNVVTNGADATVSVALTLTTGTGSLTGTATMSAVNGVADFTGKGLNINLVGTNKVLTATATVAAGVKTTTTSPAFTITFAAASQVVFTTQPSASTVAGVAFAQQPVVKIEDAFGNVVTSGADSSVSVALTLTTGTGSLTGTATMSAVNGVADFTGKGLNINLVGTNKVLTATATLAAGVKTTTTSPAFTITPGAAATIALTSGNNQSGTVGTALGSPFVVTVTDANGNPKSGTSVTFAVATTPSGATGQSLSTTSATTDSSGQASSTLTLGTKAGTYTVTATSGTLSGSPVTFTATGTAGAAATIALTSGNNQSGTVGTALGSPFVVTVTDANGNPK